MACLRILLLACRHCLHFLSIAGKCCFPQNSGRTNHKGCQNTTLHHRDSAKNPCPEATFNARSHKRLLHPSLLSKSLQILHIFSIPLQRNPLQVIQIFADDPDCHNGTGIVPGTPNYELAHDVVVVRSTSGSNPGGYIKVSRMVFSYTEKTDILRDYPNKATGLAGMTIPSLALPAQLVASLDISQEFSICLPSTAKLADVLFFSHDAPVEEQLLHRRLLHRPTWRPSQQP
ncbi:hypothetical protein SUGI_0184700 [Cryptomeria japonica]|nr:hypothetical protein SUGI_0184700 [Cryptomeria japonica]